MKTTLLTTTFLASLISTAAFAHHPAADNVDPEIYAMIDENVSDTPHADLTFDDMGGAMEDAGSAAEAAEASEERGEMSRAEVESASEASEMGQESRADVDVEMGSDEMVDTIDMMDNVVGALSE